MRLYTSFSQMHVSQLTGKLLKLCWFWKRQPRSVNEFRPISICSALWISWSLLVARWKQILPSIVSIEQTAFVGEPRSIFLVQEIWFYIRFRLNKKKNQFFIAKLDMEKACDRVRWDFLMKILRSMGSDEHWIQPNMVCATSIAIYLKWQGKMDSVKVVLYHWFYLFFLLKQSR